MHTKTVVLFIFRTELRVTPVVSQIDILYLIYGNSNGWVVEIVPQAGICCLGPGIQGNCRMRRGRHQIDIQVVIAEELEVLVGGFGSANIQFKKALERSSRYLKKANGSK